MSSPTVANRDNNQHTSDNHAGRETRWPSRLRLTDACQVTDLTRIFETDGKESLRCVVLGNVVVVTTPRKIGEFVIKRIAFLGTVAVLVASFALAMTAVASARAQRHRHHSVDSAHTDAQQPDQVVQWNQELQKVLVAPGAQPASIHPTRTMAITQIAVYDAVNGIVGYGVRCSSM